MTRAEVAEYLRVGTRRVDNYVRAGQLTKHVLAGTRTPRFRIEDVRTLVVRAQEAG